MGLLYNILKSRISFQPKIIKIKMMRKVIFWVKIKRRKNFRCGRLIYARRQETHASLIESVKQKYMNLQKVILCHKSRKKNGRKLRRSVMRFRKTILNKLDKQVDGNKSKNKITFNKIKLNLKIKIDNKMIKKIEI